MTQPNLSYLICATPRTGSFLLCEALRNVGIAGQPREYFWPGDRAYWAGRWSVTSDADFLQQAIVAGTSSNGVFGAKVMWEYFDDLASIIQQVTNKWEMSVPELFEALFPNMHYIWIRRRDKVRRAISHWRALQSNIWTWSTDELLAPAKEPVFDFSEIERLIHQNEQHESAWQSFFDTYQITPFYCFYEDFVNTYEQTAIDVLKFLSIPIPEKITFAPKILKKQADAVSEQWFEWYNQQKSQ